MDKMKNGLRRKQKILIVDDDRDFAAALSMVIDSSEKFILVGCAYDGLDAIGLIELSEPDVIIMDLILPNLDGLGVLERLSQKESGKVPSVIIVSDMMSKKTVNAAMALGAEYYMQKPVNFAQLIRRIEMFCFDAEVPVAELGGKVVSGAMQAARERSRDDTERTVSEIIRGMGIPANLSGYKYLRFAIVKAIYEPSIMSSVTKRLYPIIAEEFDTAPTRVERAIRHAIDVAWKKGNINAERTLFVQTKKPANSEFIAIIADSLRFDTV